MGVAVGMAQRVLCALLLAAALVCGGAEAAFNRHSFPKGFVFGTGSASYQYEGAYKEGGKGVSIWDTFTRIPSKIKSNDTGDVAVDFYHRYKEDVQLLKDMNMDAFRFSIAWTRILPNGSLSDGVNKEGVAFYNNLINEIISKGMEPYVTIFRWDTPQALESKYGGFLSENIIKGYADFAEVCFREFGDRVKFWNTFNEPWTYAVNGYAAGSFAPGRCSPHVSASCLGAGSVHRDAQHHPGPRGGRAAVPRQVPADAARADRHHGGLRLVRAQQRHRRRPGRRAAQPRLHAGLVPGTRRARRVPGHHAGIPRRPAAAVHRRAGGGSQGVLRLPRSQLLHRVLREERAAAQRARAVVQRRHPRQHVGVPRRRAHRRRAHRRPAVRAHLLHVPGRDPRAPALHQPAVQPAEHLHPGERHRRGEQPEHPDQGGAQGQAPHLVPLQALAVREARHPERRQSEGLLHVDVHGLLRVGRRVPGPLRPHLHRPPRRPQALPQAVQLLDREVPQETLVACAPDTLATGQEAGARAAVQVASDFNKLQSNLFSVVFVLSCL